MHLFVILLVLSAVIQSAAVKQDTGIRSASVGDNVTLHCSYDSQVAMHFSWYRQTLGGGPELLSTIYKYDKPTKVYPWMEKNPRFSVQRKDGINHLHITEVHLSDSATYFCGSSHSNVVEFGKGVFLSVKGARPKETVRQIVPASETIQSGGSVTLNCTVHAETCDGEHGVYWFRQGSRHGIVHTHRDGWERVSAGASPPQSCTYHLQKENVSPYDSGTYHCAVASCGDILFSKGSQVLVEGCLEDQMALMRTLVWLSIIRTGVLLIFVAICLLVYITKSRCSLQNGS